ncbi:hypothetical protein V6N11_068431 [Hibiscus sabdariffa]|uniref:Uncharacterized protein n=1 Tax=Hibiscus sabdariffa TaxID=183260 RepID=A0ABR1Z9G2_9ROSI
MVVLVVLDVVMYLWQNYGLVVWSLGFRRVQFETNNLENLVADRVVALCHDSLSGSMVFDSVHVELAELVRKEAFST